MPLYPAVDEANLSLVQARRTTTLALSSTFVDVAFDTTDIENDAAVVEHVAADQVQVKIDGNYQITYAVTAPAGAYTTTLDVRKNDTTVLPGSERVAVSAGSDGESITGAFVADLAANDFVTLRAKVDTGTPSLAVGATLTVVRLAGPKGDKGEASATDIAAIHKDVAGEIVTITEKTSTVANDLLLIEDSAAGNVKKRLRIGNLPGGVQLSDANPSNVKRATAAPGTGADAARYDHGHDIDVAAPAAGAVAVGNAASLGTGDDVALALHQHAVARGTPIAVGTTNAAGDGTDFACGNHQHEGLTRGANDFAAFTAKASPVSADLVLIEDSAASGAKKKATVGSLASAITPVFGSELSQGASEGESTTTLAAYQEKYRLTTSSLSGGTYRIGWYNEMRSSSVAADVLYRLQLDDLTTLAEVNNEIGDNTNYLPGSGFIYAALTAGVHTIDMDYRNETAGNTAYIRRARIELWKVSN
jgi:hypothetical protein